MKLNLSIFKAVILDSKVITIISTLTYALVLTILLFMFFKEKNTHDFNFVYFLLVMSGSMIFVTTLAEKLGKLVNAPFNHSLPNFRLNMFINIILMHVIMTGVPSLIGYLAGIASVKMLLLVNAIAFSVFIFNIVNIIFGSVWFAAVILSLATELSKAKKSDGYQFYQEYGFDHNLMLTLLFITTLAVLIVQLFRRPSNSTPKNDNSSEEINIRYKKFKIMTLLDRYWIVFKFKLFKRLGLLINRVDTVLLSGQYQAITIIRLIIFILALMTFFNQGVKDFLMGLQYGLSGDGASVETLSDGIVVGTSVIWLSILACFDNSILTRLRFAQRFIWLREPIDGFDNFKHFFGQTLIRKILIEVFVTLGIYVMLIISLAPSFKISVFLLLGFFAFKGFSILLGLIMIDRINSKVIYWVVAISYALYFGFWIFLAINIEVSDLVALSLVIILTASFFTLGYKRFLNEPVINS